MDVGVAAGGEMAATGGAAGVARCGGGGFGRCERVSPLAVPAGTANDGGAGSLGGAAVSVEAAGGREGGRGGAGRLRLAEGGAESGR